MSRTRIVALALAAALPFSAVQVAMLPATAQTDVTLDSTEKRAALAAQAVEELINEYRVANGLHPLVTHELYDEGALGWSAQMAADVPTRGLPSDYEDPYDDRSALRHSDIKAMGYSGENIAYHTGFADTEADWKRAAEAMFEVWRNSPDHNENMLRADVQGMGLGLKLDERGIVWGTTWFFIDDAPVKAPDGKLARLQRDKVTERAVASGKPFYTPAGAKQRLGVGDVVNPTDTKKYEISYLVDIDDKVYTVLQSGGKTTLNKTINAQRGMDPAVTGKSSTSANLPPVPTLPKPVDRPVPPENTTSTPGPAKPSGPAGPSGKPAGDKKSTEPTKPAASTTTATPAGDTGDKGSSTAGIVIGVVVGLLAVIGVAVAALPMVAPDLARQFGM